MNHAAPTSAATEGLVSYLDAQRRHVLGILEGLDEDALRTPALPSGWTFLGLVAHLTVDVERLWFRGAVAAEPAALAEAAAATGGAWDVGPDVPADAVLSGYRDETERADAIIRATPLDAPPAWWPRELFGEWRLADLGQVRLHVITETAVHAGHLDAARELVDGRTWLVLD
jgi:hypothetical protein